MAAHNNAALGWTARTFDSVFGGVRPCHRRSWRDYGRWRNIDHATRVLTTAIALETGKGDFGLALGLGFVLIFMALSVNLAIHYLTRTEVEGRW